jgi:mannose-6-phosphate isomerase-like protein (cupin superfamily)
MNVLRLTKPTRRSTQSQFNLYAVLAGRGHLRFGEELRALAPGDVWLVPASTSYHHFEPEGGELVLLHTLYRP